MRENLNGSLISVKPFRLGDVINGLAPYENQSGSSPSAQRSVLPCSGPEPQPAFARRDLGRYLIITPARTSCGSRRTSPR